MRKCILRKCGVKGKKCASGLNSWNLSKAMLLYTRCENEDEGASKGPDNSIYGYSACIVYGQKGRCCDNTPHHIHASRAPWTEVKLRDMVREARCSRSDLALIEFCAHSGQVHLGSSVHLNSDIIPEYKASEAWKSATVCEMRWSSVHASSDALANCSILTWLHGNKRRVRTAVGKSHILGVSLSCDSHHAKRA